MAGKDPRMEHILALAAHPATLTPEAWAAVGAAEARMRNRPWLLHYQDRVSMIRVILATRDAAAVFAAAVETLSEAMAEINLPNAD